MTHTIQIHPCLSQSQEQDLGSRAGTLNYARQEAEKARTAWESTSSCASQHPASPKLVSTQPWERVPRYLAEMDFSHRGMAREAVGASGQLQPGARAIQVTEEAACSSTISHPGTARTSRWIIPGFGRTHDAMLETTVAQLCEERSPNGGANSCKSTGTDHSQPSQLREEPWHQVQTQIFPSPVSAAAQTTDGIAQTSLNQPSPFSPALATLHLSIIPANTPELRRPVCGRDGGDTIKGLFPPAQRSAEGTHRSVAAGSPGL